MSARRPFALAILVDVMNQSNEAAGNKPVSNLMLYAGAGFVGAQGALALMTAHMTVAGEPIANFDPMTYLFLLVAALAWATGTAVSVRNPARIAKTGKLAAATIAALAVTAVVVVLAAEDAADGLLSLGLVDGIPFALIVAGCLNAVAADRRATAH